MRLMAMVGLWGLLACRPETPEAQVRRTFEACRSAVEAGDAAAAAAPLDPAFRGPEGMDRNTARGFLLAVFRREKVGITVLRNEVEVRGAQAFQEVDLLLTGRRGGLLPQEASRRTLALRWRRQDGAWRLLEVQEGISPPGIP